MNEKTNEKTNESVNEGEAALCCPTREDCSALNDRDHFGSRDSANAKAIDNDSITYSSSDTLRRRPNGKITDKNSSSIPIKGSIVDNDNNVNDVNNVNNVNIVNNVNNVNGDKHC